MKQHSLHKGIIVFNHRVYICDGYWFPTYAACEGYHCTTLFDGEKVARKEAQRLHDKFVKALIEHININY